MESFHYSTKISEVVDALTLNSWSVWQKTANVTPLKLLSSSEDALICEVRDRHTHTFALPRSKLRFYTTGSSQHHTAGQHGAHSTAAQMQIQAAHLTNKYFLSQDLNCGIPHPQPEVTQSCLSVFK